MPRKRRKWRHRPDKYRGGRVIINQIDYSKRDYISPGRLVAWAEPERKDKHDEPAPGAYDGLTEQEIEQLEAERGALLKRLWTRPEGT